jgi:hypothetical protein
VDDIFESSSDDGYDPSGLMMFVSNLMADKKLFGEGFEKPVTIYASNLSTQRLLTFSSTTTAQITAVDVALAATAEPGFFPPRENIREFPLCCSASTLLNNPSHRLYQDSVGDGKKNIHLFALGGSVKSSSADNESPEQMDFVSRVLTTTKQAQTLSAHQQLVNAFKSDNEPLASYISINPPLDPFMTFDPKGQAFRVRALKIALDMLGTATFNVMVEQLGFRLPSSFDDFRDEMRRRLHTIDRPTYEIIKAQREFDREVLMLKHYERLVLTNDKELLFDQNVHILERNSTITTENNACVLQWLSKKASSTLVQQKAKCALETRANLQQIIPISDEALWHRICDPEEDDWSHIRLYLMQLSGDKLIPYFMKSAQFVLKTVGLSSNRSVASAIQPGAAAAASAPEGSDENAEFDVVDDITNSTEHPFYKFIAEFLSFLDQTGCASTTSIETDAIRARAELYVALKFNQQRFITKTFENLQMLKANINKLITHYKSLKGTGYERIDRFFSTRLDVLAPAIESVANSIS